MKRAFFSFTLLLTMLSAWACYGLPPTDNYYMFSIINRKVFDDDGDPFHLSDHWNSYLRSKNGAENTWGLAWVDLKKFNKSENKIIKTALKRKDSETIKYLKLIIEFSQNTGSDDHWQYPTKQQLAQRKSTLLRIKNAAMAYNSTRYKNQYAYLVMRCNMILKAHQDNVNYWEKYASKLKDSNFKMAMKNIYAGALYNTGQRDKACDIFVEMGDFTSIKYCVRKDRNLAGIKTQYAQNPNRPTLMFLVQDFVNNTQESIDDDYDEDGCDFAGAKLIQRQEAMDFVAFAKQVLDEGKTKYPSMWEAARGFVNYLYDNNDDAVSQLTHATQLAGTERMKDNARASLALARTRCAQPNDDFFNYLIGEFSWLEKKAGSKEIEEYGYKYKTYEDPHYADVLHRIAILGVAQRFTDLKMYDAAFATYCMTDSLENKTYFDRIWGNHKSRIDSISSTELYQFHSYLKNKNVSKLEKWIIERVPLSEDMYNDFMGTKLIRENKCADAIPYLEKVPLSFYSTLRISAYMNQRDYKNMERWKKRQTNIAKCDNEDEWQDFFNVSHNDKLDFCRDIIAISQQIENANGEERLELMYKKASMLFQASYFGDCWYISSYYSGFPQIMSDETAHILSNECIKLLKEIKRSSTNQQMRVKAQYAYTYVIGESDKNCFGYDLVNGEWESILDRNCEHFFALRNLNNMLAQTEEINGLEFITKCDVLKAFRNNY